MIKVGIVGGSGYTGVQLMALLLRHPDVAVEWVTSRKFEGQSFHETFGALRSMTRLTFTSFSPKLLEEVDLVFTAVPHGQAMDLVAEVARRGKRVIDLSADYRFQDVSLYERAYQPHSEPELARKAVYGLPELFEEDIRHAELIGNPGCYPTAAILAAAPLVLEGHWDLRTPMIVDAKSGVSGAGRDPNLATHFPEVDEGLAPYKVLAHRHQPEIASILQRKTGGEGAVYFVPHLVPMNRGILSTVYVPLKEAMAPEQVQALYESFYAGKPFVRVLPAGKAPSTHHVRGSNFCDVGVTLSPDGRLAVAMSAIDNLIKGASGQAVQNMNIMMGLEETAGVSQLPLFP